MEREGCGGENYHGILPESSRGLCSLRSISASVASSASLCKEDVPPDELQRGFIADRGGPREPLPASHRWTNARLLGVILHDSVQVALDQSSISAFHVGQQQGSAPITVDPELTPHNHISCTDRVSVESELAVWKQRRGKQGPKVNEKSTPLSSNIHPHSRRAQMRIVGVSVLERQGPLSQKHRGIQD